MVKVTRKYQVTIPKNIREELGIRIGDEIEFIKSKEGISIIKVSKEDEYHSVLEEAAGALRLDKEKLKEIQESIGETLHV